VSASSVSDRDRDYLNIIRGISISRVVLVHLGLSWFFTPYSEFIHVFLPVLFFVSGGVLVHSYHRSESIGDFLKKRIISIYIPYILVVIISFSIIWIYEKRFPDIDYELLFHWLTMNTDRIHDSMPFPLNQVWYLHALLFIVLISPVFFKMGIKNQYLFIIPILISVMFSIFQLYYDIGHSLFIYGHNLYQPIVNMGFFFFGAMYYFNNKMFTKKLLLTIFLITIAIGFILGAGFIDDINMYKHTYAPDLYYVSLSFSAILSFLLLQPIVEAIVKNIYGLKWFFIFMSRHSYSVFLLHSLVLIKVHTWFELGGVMGDPIRASIKILLVFLITCFIAVPFTALTRKITNTFLNVFNDSNSKSNTPLLRGS